MRDKTAIENEDNNDLSVVWDVLAWALDPRISDDNVTNYIPEV